MNSETDWDEFQAAEPCSRFDQFLSQHYPEMSRSRAQKLIESGEALLEGKTVKPSHKVRENADIRVKLHSEPMVIALKPEDIPLNILFEDEDVLVVNKPPGMVVHPAHGNWNGTLVNALLFHCSGSLSKGHLNISGEERPGIVHRIDKNTSGILVVAKNDLAHQHLAKQFHDHTISRKYQGICWGILPESGKWNQAIGRDSTNRQRMALQPKGKKAITQFKRLATFAGCASYFEAVLQTGRTHQIRVHFSHNGFPLVGDMVYMNCTRTARRSKETALSKLRKVDPKLVDQIMEITLKSARQMLHAFQLGFVHPGDGKKQHFEVDPPKDFQEVLDCLQLHNPEE